MKNKTKEDAYLEMLKPAETITFKVQNCVDSLADIRECPGDGFFIRYAEFRNVLTLLPVVLFSKSNGFILPVLRFVLGQSTL